MSSNKREKLIRVGSEIIIRQGFKAASLNEILTTAGIPKGSFYYYFASKEDFGLAIIEDFAQQDQHRLENTLKDTRFSPLTRLRNYFEAKITEMKNCQCIAGCLIGNLGQELSAQNEVFRDRLKQIFVKWQDYFAQCLQDAYQTGELKSDRHIPQLANFILSSWQGAILQAKVTKSTIPMENFVKILFEQILINA
jgi:TetR/AcrR family transcriptional regulator, transcriptional repressor for nem operon